MIILNAYERASQMMTGGEACLASFFLLELGVGVPSCWIIYDNEGQV
jgi:hypothetical protein